MSGTIFLLSLLILVVGIVITCYVEKGCFGRVATLHALLLTCILFIGSMAASFCFWDLKDALIHTKHSDIVTLDYLISKAPTEVIASLKERGYSVIRVEDYRGCSSRVGEDDLWRFETYARDENTSIKERYESLSCGSK